VRGSAKQPRVGGRELVVGKRAGGVQVAEALDLCGQVVGRGHRRRRGRGLLLGALLRALLVARGDGVNSVTAPPASTARTDERKLSGTRSWGNWMTNSSAGRMCQQPSIISWICVDLVDRIVAADRAARTSRL
jgi:hypothetical protein